jgi:hypothetical protein
MDFSKCGGHGAVMGFSKCGGHRPPLQFWFGFFALDHFDGEWDAGQGATVHGQVNGVKAGLVELQLLDVDDEIAGHESGVGGEKDLDGNVHGGHDGLAVLVHEIHGQLVGAFFDAVKGDAEGDGALGVLGGELGGEDGVESAEQVEFAVVIGCRVAENSHLDSHKVKQCRMAAGKWKRENAK